MSVPAFLRTVDRKIDLKIRFFFPFVADFLDVHEVVHASRAVNNHHFTVIVAIMTNVIDDAAQRREPDAARDKEQIFALEISLDGEIFTVRPADGDLLSDFQRMDHLGDAAAFFNGKLHVLFVRRRRRDREHTLADAGDGNHRALAGQMLERLFPVRADDAESLDVGRIPADIGDDSDFGYQILVNHAFLLLSS